MSRTGELLSAAASFDFGYSTVARDDVVRATWHAVGSSVTLVAGTTLLLLAVGVPLGLASAARPRQLALRTANRVVDLLSALPVLVWSTLIFVLAARAGGVILRGDARLAPAIAAAVLALFLGDRLLSDLVQRVTVRGREVLAEPYMRTVRASGFGVRRHLLLSVVPAVGESVASRAVFLVSGAIVAERVFAVNGLGFLVIQALVQQEQEPRLVLAAAMALVCIALSLRAVSRTAALLADPRLGQPRAT